MAIDLISENNSNLPTSPRISFSYDLCPKDTSIEDHSDSCHQSPNNSDFNFSIITNSASDTETTCADELFSGGLIRPIPLQQRPVSSKQAHMSKPQPPSNTTTQSKPPIWNSRRSSSLRCENGHKKTPFWSSFPLLLSRSFSTGSLGKGKKQSAEPKKQRNSSSSSATFYTFPSLRRASNNGGGVRINPVINILPHNVSKDGAANLFRFGSLFRNGKEKNKKLNELK